MNEYEEFIVDWIVKKKNIELSEINLTADIFEAGYLDSLSVFSLVMDIESKFNVNFNAEDLTSCSTYTIKLFANLIPSKETT